MVEDLSAYDPSKQRQRDNLRVHPRMVEALRRCFDAVQDGSGKVSR